MTMTHGSLFSGIGGFDLAAHSMGWQNVFHCEINPFANRILNYYWPHAKAYTDIKKTDFSVHHAKIYVLSGGFPCQPYSNAGKRLGKEDDRHLWPEMLRAIREISPRWVVGENVRGLTNWNGGLVFDEVQSDLETQGYKVLPFLLPACALNAPHRRDRIWFVAYAEHSPARPAGNSAANEGSGAATLHEEGQGGQQSAVLDPGLCDLQRDAAHADGGGGVQDDGKGVADDSDQTDQAGDAANPHHTGRRKGHKENAGRTSKQSDGGGFQHAADSDGDGLQGGRQPGDREAAKRQALEFYARGSWDNWQNFPSQSPICGGNDGIPRKLDRVTFSKWRNESIKGYGNAIVPAVAIEIFKSIEQYEKFNYHH